MVQKMNETFMNEKPVLRLITSMALPMVISMLVHSRYNIADSFFVAQISEDAMTALSLVYPVQNLINAVAIGFGVGLNAVISFHLGAGDTAHHLSVPICGDHHSGFLTLLYLRRRLFGFCACSRRYSCRVCAI